MHLLKSSGYRNVAWKNGGGNTAEIAVFPEGASVEDFDWRLSMADVASDGPFSLFPEIDRTLTLLSGRGMVLDIEERGRVMLDPASAPLAFAGDVRVQADLVDGPVRDLNVMSRRGRYTHRVEAFTVRGYKEIDTVSSSALLFCRDGKATLGAIEVEALDTVVLQAGKVTIEGDAAFCLVILQKC